MQKNVLISNQDLKISNKKSKLFIGSLFAILHSTAGYSIELSSPSFWLGFQQSDYDFFNNDNSKIQPDGLLFGASVQLNDNWVISLSRGENDGAEQWQQSVSEDIRLESGAETEDESFGLSASLHLAEGSLSFAVNRSESQELSLSRLPAILERIDSESLTYSFSYQHDWSQGSWLPTWQIGVQYSDVNLTADQLILFDPPVATRVILDQKRWNLFSDISLSYWSESDLIDWSPSITLGWTWEIDETGTTEGFISRSGEVRRLSSLNNRLTEGFRIPDSGYVELAALFMLSNEVSSTLGYNETIDAQQNITTWYLDISYQF